MSENQTLETIIPDLPDQVEARQAIALERPRETKQPQSVKMTLDDTQGSVLQQSNSASLQQTQKFKLNYNKEEPRAGTYSYVSLEQKEGNGETGPNDKHSESSTNSEDGKASRPALRQEVVTPSTQNEFKGFPSIKNGSRNALQLINEPQLNTGSDTAKLRYEDTVGNVQPCPVIEAPQGFKDLELFAWGLNDAHQLGQVGSNSPRPYKGLYSHSVLIPRRLKDLRFKPSLAACGTQHTLLVSEDGEVWGLGSNSCGQLGLEVKSIPVVSELTKIPVETGGLKVKDVACGEKHSLLQVEGGRVFSAGVNEAGQAGLRKRFATDVFVESFTEVDLPLETVDKMRCGASSSAFLDIGRQQLVVCGALSRAQDELFEVIELAPLLRAGGADAIVDVQCASNALILLARGGQVLLREEEAFRELEQLPEVTEIAAYGDHFAALTSSNTIFSCASGQFHSMQPLECEQMKAVHLRRLTVGSDFGHVIDEEGNLYGWGNNKNGELGTSDSYPRTKLAQVRIFNSEQQYMRCYKIFSGHAFSFGLFESNVSPNGIKSPAASQSIKFSSTLPGKSLQISAPLSEVPGSGRSMLNKTQVVRLAPADQPPLPPANTQQMLSSRNHLGSEHEVRKEQYKATELAIQRYREQARSYKRNISLIQHAAERDSIDNQANSSTLVNPHHLSLTDHNHSKTRSIGAIEAFQSLNPSEQLKQSTYSPDILVTKLPPESQETLSKAGSQRQVPERRVGTQVGPGAMEDNQYSFSRLDYVFDDTKKELRVFHERAREAEAERSRSRSKQKEQRSQRSLHGSDYFPHQAEVPARLVSSTAHSRRPSETRYARPPSYSGEQNTRRLAGDTQRQQARGRKEVEGWPSEGGHAQFSGRAPSEHEERAQVPAPAMLEPVRHQGKARHAVSQERRPQRSRGELDEIIEKSISSASSVLLRSRQSRSFRSNLNRGQQPPQHREEPHQRPLEEAGTRYSQRGQLHQPSDANTFRFPTLKQHTPGMSASTLTNPLNKHASKETYELSVSNANTSQHFSQSDLQSKPAGYVDLPHRMPAYGPAHYHPQYSVPEHVHSSSVSCQEITNTKSTIEHLGVKTSQRGAQQQPDPALTSKLTRYKRKLKKYIKQNQELHTQVHRLKESNDTLQRQNERMLRTERQEDHRLQAMLDQEVRRREELEEKYHALATQKKELIAQLTAENRHMMDELQDRDEKHRLLEERLEYLDQEVVKITDQMTEKNKLIQQLEIENAEFQHQMHKWKRISIENQRKQNKVDDAASEGLRSPVLRDCPRSRSGSHYRAQFEKIEQLRASALHQGRQEMELQVQEQQATIAELQRQVRDLQKECRERDEELMVKKGEINHVKKKYGQSKRHGQTLELTVNDLQAKLHAMETREFCEKNWKQDQMLRHGRKVVEEKQVYSSRPHEARYGKPAQMNAYVGLKDKMSTIEEGQGPSLESGDNDEYPQYSPHQFAREGEERPGPHCNQQHVFSQNTFQNYKPMRSERENMSESQAVHKQSQPPSSSRSARTNSVGPQIRVDFAHGGPNARDMLPHNRHQHFEEVNPHDSQNFLSSFNLSAHIQPPPSAQRGAGQVAYRIKDEAPRRDDQHGRHGRPTSESGMFMNENSDLQNSNRFQEFLHSSSFLNNLSANCSADGPPGTYSNAPGNANLAYVQQMYYNPLTSSYDAEYPRTYAEPPRQAKAPAYAPPQIVKASTMHTMTSRQVLSPNLGMLTNASGAIASRQTADSPRAMMMNPHDVPRQMLHKSYAHDGYPAPNLQNHAQALQPQHLEWKAMPQEQQLLAPHSRGHISGASFPSSAVDFTNQTSKRNIGHTQQHTPKRQKLKFADLSESQQQLAIELAKQQCQSRQSGSRSRSNEQPVSAGHTKPSMQSSVAKPPGYPRNSQQLSSNQTQALPHLPVIEQKSEHTPGANRYSDDGDDLNKSVHSYKDSIRSKFAKRTTDKIVDTMKARDLENPVKNRVNTTVTTDLLNAHHENSRNHLMHDNPDSNNNTADKTQTNSNVPKNIVTEKSSEKKMQLNHTAKSLSNSMIMDNKFNDSGMLTNEERFTQIFNRRNKECEKVEEFKEQSKNWQVRRGRSQHNGSLSSHDITMKYREAFRNLSLELKKKMGEGNKN